MKIDIEEAKKKFNIFTGKTGSNYYAHIPAGEQGVSVVYKTAQTEEEAVSLVLDFLSKNAALHPTPPPTKKVIKL